MNITREGILNWSYIDTCKCQIECLSINQYLPTISAYLLFFLIIVLLFFLFVKENIFPNKAYDLKEYVLYILFLLFLGFQVAVWFAILLGGKL